MPPPVATGEGGAAAPGEGGSLVKHAVTVNEHPHPVLRDHPLPLRQARA
jgi:hypothetical protein